ncbi:quinone-dependent dihydroorotate dehydrogenase [Lacihabitans sp. LS3-19]|uniref:quinone-dependent dihydroorotate dehydrogenase n=1 Tax=Lacihabitans sp. LS3-19 TaxID=2487335 RepID=UPI0020CC9939|nr:quinone-dependent dihydroorotate dehydrogenase [Lacihabitans sp. LS3-19]MCP9767966.1 quinone-dependent dihydroorotate dehydrogenase [Lacihabitans sp. LS3-19]
MYKKIVFPVLSQFDPERIHYFAMGALTFVCKIPGFKAILRNTFEVKSQSLHRNFLGLDFKNPVGLAAGFDKNARWIDELDVLGFGFIEIGTVTPKSQEGNPKPRLFRLKPDEALINRMGFNNGGVKEVVENLKKRNSEIIVGGNIGKNKLTENEDALSDYLIAFKGLVDYVDYFVVNVSSPNTPGLRDLQEKEPLKKILSALQIENQKHQKPVLLKIAPDLTNSQLDDIVEIVTETKISGVIATNTTLSREGLKTPAQKVQEIGAGGLSGKPLRNRSTEVIRYLSEKSQGKFGIIGAGGIYTAEDAKEKLEAGASLIQVYSGFVYEGPAIAKNINNKLKK